MLKKYGQASSMYEVLSVTRSRDFARKWRFLEAAHALKFGPRALREFKKTGAFWVFQKFYVVKINYYF